MPGVESNTKYRCNGCGTILDFTGRLPTPCPNCGHGDMRQIVVQHVCDFCSSPNARWKYDCADFRSPDIPGAPVSMSRGAWAACDGCHELIEKDERDTLAARAVRQHPHPVARLALPIVRAQHELFFANRRGDGFIDR